VNPDELFTGDALAAARCITDGDIPALTRAAQTLDLDAPGRDGATLLFYAFWCARAWEPERLDVVTALVRLGANAFVAHREDVGSVFDHALQVDRPDLLRALLDGGVSANARTHGGAAPCLFEVLTTGGRAHRELLLARGAEVGATDTIGRTALMEAALRCEIDTVHELLDRGADPSAVDATGLTLAWVLRDLREGTEDGTPEAQRLDDAVARITYDGRVGWPPLSPAAERARAEGAATRR
jgi:hypothetical protein